MKKYELTTETKVVSGHTLYRIRALVAFGSVDTGELGGWIENETNLAQYGNAWVYGNARVYGNAQVYGDAWVYGDAEVYGNAQVYGNAEVCDNAAIMTVSHIGSRFGTTTFFVLNNGKIGVQCGCFYGDIDEFAAKVEQTHGNNQHGKAYKLAIELAKLRLQTRKE